MAEKSKYIYYRNRRIPDWWEMYLPCEQNPYEETDTLTLEIGCLSDYWHIHSSNKHPNFRGAEACNYVHDMIYKRFGGAFLSSQWCSCAGRQGEKIYRDTNHIVYRNACIGDDNKIHILNAKQYYEDVVTFVQGVLREIAKNHYQSGNSFEAQDFFPSATDAEIEKNRMIAEKKKAKTAEYRKELQEYIAGEKFYINEIIFEKVRFNACYDFWEGWFNVGFSFGKINSNNPIGNITIIVVMPYLAAANHDRKNVEMATKILDVPYCLYFHGNSDNEAYPVTIAIPAEKVSDCVKQRIDEACNQAMDAYNKENTERIENSRCTPTLKNFPYNIFLDNQVGKLRLVYDENVNRGILRVG